MIADDAAAAAAAAAGGNDCHDCGDKCDDCFDDGHGEHLTACGVALFHQQQVSPVCQVFCTLKHLLRLHGDSASA